MRPAELHSPSAEENCLTENVASLRSVKELTDKLMVLLLEKKELHGSTGILMIREGRILFYPNGSEVPSVNRPMIWEKKTSGSRTGNK